MDTMKKLLNYYSKKQEEELKRDIIEHCVKNPRRLPDEVGGLRLYRTEKNCTNINEISPIVMVGQAINSYMYNNMK
jgi:hypothetical protein